MAVFSTISTSTLNFMGINEPYIETDCYTLINLYDHNVFNNSENSHMQYETYRLYVDSNFINYVPEIYGVYHNHFDNHEHNKKFDSDPILDHAFNSPIVSEHETRFYLN